MRCIFPGMIPEIRDWFNQQYSDARYQAFLEELYKVYDHVPGFRIAETPVFIPRALGEQIFRACDDIIDVIVRPDFKALSASALRPGYIVPNEDAHTTFLQIDFGLCEGPDGTVVPKLIEVQGFPSLYCYQHVVAGLYRKHFDIPDRLHHLFNGYAPETYVQLLRDVILGDADPKETVLLDIEPYKQNTQIDFRATAALLGIHVACVTELFQRGRQLFYRDAQGCEVAVRRIYNRTIFDELIARRDISLKFDFTDDLDVKWVGHPNWFFRISKHTIPFLHGDFIPKTHFLDKLERLPDDLENYVLKPLFSFSGSGVVFSVSTSDIEAVKNPSEYILQEKVNYLPVIRTPDHDPVKVEVRIMCIWPEGAPRPIVVNNLARLSKGVMIGVKYNKNKTWVGGSVGFYE